MMPAPLLRTGGRAAAQRLAVMQEQSHRFWFVMSARAFHEWLLLPRKPPSAAATQHSGTHLSTTTLLPSHCSSCFRFSNSSSLSMGLPS